MAVEVWWSDLTAAGRDLLGLLDATELVRVGSLDRPADRGRSLLGAALLRVATASRLGVAPAEVRVDRTCADCGAPHGAPRLLGPGSALPAVSVSHSGLLVAVAVSTDGPVGVDVQRLADLADPPTAGRWARTEALAKAGVAGPGATGPMALEDVSIRELVPPLGGYVAALAAPAGAATVVRHWPPP
jgi:4'-phosphopantetheinyl transferase